MKHLLFRIACIWALVISASPSATADDILAKRYVKKIKELVK